MSGTMYASDVSTREWIQIIRAEYNEMPGLSLTKQQVGRLWGLDTATTDAVLNVLIGIGFLRCTNAGGYVRSDGGV